MAKMDTGIISALQAIGQNIKTAGNKAAADAPTSHPVGSAPDGDTPAKTGEFASTNEADSKRTGGKLSVENSGSEVPMSKQENKPNQAPLNPTDATGAVPSEIKPGTVTASGDSDSPKTPNGDVETGDGGEGRIGGVGGPKFASSKLDTDIQNAIKKANMALGGPQAPAAQVAPTAPARATGPVTPVTPVAPAAKIAAANEIPAEAAAELVEMEKLAAQQIVETLQAAGIGPEAPLAVKRACLVRAFRDAAVKNANGYIVTLDPATLQAVLSGDTTKSAMDDTSGVMPGAVSGGDGGGTPPGAGGAPAGDPSGGGAPPADGGAGGGQAEQMIAQILQGIQQGAIQPEEAKQMLTQLGVPPEVIEQILAAAGGGGGAAGGDPAAAGGAPAPADAGAAPAGGASGPSDVTPAAA